MKNPNGDTWNKRLSYALEKRGMSQTELAKRVGVSDPTVTAWVTDQATLKADNKAKVDAALDLPSRYLLEGACTLEDTHLVTADMSFMSSVEAGPTEQDVAGMTAERFTNLVEKYAQKADLSEEQRMRIVRAVMSDRP